MQDFDYTLRYSMMLKEMVKYYNIFEEFFGKFV